MFKVILIRHGKTYGNTLKRYIGGRTDEPLCQEGIRLLQEKSYPQASFVYVSPMKRCHETAACLYPGIETEVCEKLRECDFGIFENKNYQELNGNQAYQAWIDSNGTLPFPGGESQESFQKRCGEGFAACVEEALQHHRTQVAMVVHGGTIMSILSRYALPRGRYFQWQIDNGEYYQLTIEPSVWKQEERISQVEKGL
ncbi:MAG: histidine phosphatase family protein [Firmicutes bacterium]|nr:histidine phosphatase family protein [Bacillota bacterium]